MNLDLDVLKENIAFVIPYLVVVVILAVISVRHILKHPNVRFGNKIIWIIIVCAVQIIGPVLYFTIGKEAEE